jgi:hypothetical protein
VKCFTRILPAVGDKKGQEETDMTLVNATAESFTGPDALPLGGPFLWLIFELRRRRQRSAMARAAQ